MAENNIEDLIPERTDIDPNVDASEIQRIELSAQTGRDRRRANLNLAAQFKARSKSLETNKKNFGAEDKQELKADIRREKREQTIELIKTAEATQPILVVDSEEAALATTTKLDVLKLMQKLQINPNIQLTKTDTYNLLASLLMCNEQQLTRMQNNAKTPMVIKIIIMRLMKDAASGDITAIEKIWDRIFGKGIPGVFDNPEGAVPGIIPNHPVSRETYVLIREQFVGRQ